MTPPPTYSAAEGGGIPPSDKFKSILIGSFSPSLRSHLYYYEAAIIIFREGGSGSKSLKVILPNTL